MLKLVDTKGKIKLIADACEVVHIFSKDTQYITVSNVEEALADNVTKNKIEIFGFTSDPVEFYKTGKYVRLDDKAEEAINYFNNLAIGKTEHPHAVFKNDKNEIVCTDEIKYSFATEGYAIYIATVTGKYYIDTEYFKL